MQQAVLVFPVHPEKEEIWLAKKVGKVVDGRLNGWGGKIERGEDPVRAACREFSEETGGASVRLQDLSYVALGVFHNHEDDGSVSIWEVHTFLAKAWFGNIQSTRTMRDPRVYRFGDIPKLPPGLLLPGDREWLPKILKDHRYYIDYPMRIRATYSPGQRQLVGPVEIGSLRW